MKAVILAAGEGTRLRPVTGDTLPKPMVDLGPGPLLKHILNSVTGFGVEEIIINLHHQGAVITEFVGEEWARTPVHYSEEEELLGTAGALNPVTDRLDDTFLLIYGDIFTNLELAAFRRFHRKQGAAASMLVYREEELASASIVTLDAEQDVTAFVEKPSPDTIQQYAEEPVWTNGSVFFLEPTVLDLIPDGFSDLSRDVFPELVASDHRFCGYQLPRETYWREIGTPDRYRAAVEDLKEGRVRFQNGT